MRLNNVLDGCRRLQQLRVDYPPFVRFAALVAVDIVHNRVDVVDIFSTNPCESPPCFLDETDDLPYPQCY